MSTNVNMHYDIEGADILQSKDKKFREYRSKWEEFPKKGVVDEFPLHLDIEVTSFCNLRCPFCTTTYTAKKIKNGYMIWDTAKRILDEAGQFELYACKFNFRGEPLLHKELGKIIQYAKKKGVMDVFFNTNGLLMDEDKSEMLIDSGLDRLTLSFEGWNREIYEKYRKGSDFQQVVSNIDRLRKIRDRRGSETPKIRVQGVLVPEMKEDLKSYVAFWKDKADQVSYNEMLDNVPGNVPPVVSDWVCPMPYQRMMVMWDGTITTCYNDHFGKNQVGHIEDTSLHDCWKKSLARIRDIHKKGLAHELSACRECPFRWMHTRLDSGSPLRCVRNDGRGSGV